MAVGYLRLNTNRVQCSASNAATRLDTVVPGKNYKAVTISAPHANSGTLTIAGASATAVSGYGLQLIPGQAADLGTIPTMGQIWGEIDISTVYVRSNSGTVDSAVFTYYTVE